MQEAENALESEWKQAMLSVIILHKTTSAWQTDVRLTEDKVLHMKRRNNYEI